VKKEADVTEATAEKPKKKRAPKEGAEPKKKKLSTAQRLRLTGDAPPAPTNIDVSDANSRYALKRKVRIFYDLQRMRLQVEGRIEPKAKGAEIQITEFDVYRLKSRAKELYDAERNALADVEEHLKAISFYRDKLTDKSVYKGIGPTLAGVLLAEVDWVRSTTISQVWAFAGLRPVDAWRCKRCNGVVTLVDASAGPEDGAFEHKYKSEVKCSTGLTQGDVYASGTSQRPTRGEKLPYNAWLRTKLVGVLGPILLKVGSPYRSFYDDYKRRWENAGKGRSDGHRHQAAIRYMVKMLLVRVWEDFRDHYELPKRPSYAEEYLGKKHHEKPTRAPASPVDREAERQRMIDAEIAAALAQVDED